MIITAPQPLLISFFFAPVRGHVREKPESDNKERIRQKMKNEGEGKEQEKTQK